MQTRMMHLCHTLWRMLSQTVVLYTYSKSLDHHIIMSTMKPLFRRSPNEQAQHLMPKRLLHLTPNFQGPLPLAALPAAVDQRNVCHSCATNSRGIHALRGNHLQGPDETLQMNQAMTQNLL